VILTKLIERWHDAAAKRLGLLNLLLLGLSALLLADLANLGIDADWLHLFDSTDRVVQDYRRLGAEASNTHTLYVRLTSRNPDVSRTVSDAVRGIEGIAAVGALAQGEAPEQYGWLKVDLRRDLALSQEGRWALLDEVRAACSRLDGGAAVTGTEAILEEFTASVGRDFVRTSVVALTLVGLVIFSFLGFTRCVALGFAYEMVGLLLSLVLFRHIYGSLNMLSAALPCVLVGLGVDFVVHALSAVQDADPKEDAGIHVYRRVTRPMFWGATTTALAFLSLTLADMPGLRPVGIMGCLAILCMFVSVFLFLPAAISRSRALGRTPVRQPGARGGLGKLLVPRTTPLRRSAALSVLLLCLALSVFALDARLEDNVENLYDPQMESLTLQSELTRQVGVYPSLLFASFRALEPERVLLGLSDPSTEFLVDPSSARLAQMDGEAGAEVSVQVMARSNPFDPRNLKQLERYLQQAVQSAGGSELALTGDAVLSQHMNDLLVRGMTTAFLVVFALLAIVLTIMFRNAFYVAFPLSVLGLSIVATLGGISLLGVNVSAYNLTLFPLFVGIGVDDCLYVANAIQRRGSLDSSPYVVRGITLTTITTLVAYGSLMFARNVGFAAMGTTACLGLTLTFLCAVYLLPLLLPTKSDPTAA
jgi:predicted RND superfamily exporter protein